MEISYSLSSPGYLRKDLKKLELFLSEYAESLDGILKDAVQNTLIVGGKRIRPALFLICARNESYDIKYLLPAAASIEIIHTASLIHDDIIDESVLRRGRKTIHNTYDKDTAKFVGDYLFTHTFSLLNSYGDKRLLLEMSEAAKLLVKGEFDQLKTKRNINQSEDVYFEKINEKTSSLFKVSCALGGILSNSSESDIENMRKFGEYAGISFQINDDLIDVDINKSSSKIGKPVGNDLRQGDITLPFIYGLSDSSFRKEAEYLLLKDNLTDDDLQNIIRLLLKTDAIEKTREKFNYYLKKARKTVDSIYGRERRASLYAVCDSVMLGTRRTG